MKLDRVLYQKSYFYFFGFFLLMIAGFWVSYFTEVLNQENYRMHTHGIAMISWCIMLVVQAYLVSRKQLIAHKQIGIASYFLVPIIAFTTVDLYKFRLSQVSALGPRDYLFTASVLNALLLFLIFYGLAIAFRKTPVVHGRYMVCTVFPMFTAIIDRIIMSFFPALLPLFPSVEGPVLQVVGLTLGDVLLVALSLWDYRAHKRWDVFPVALVLHGIYHYSVLNFYRYPFWQSFSDWFYKL